MRLCCGKEIIHQPAHVEKRPFDFGLLVQDVAEGGAGVCVEGWFERVEFCVADVFGGDEAFAVGAVLAGAEEGGVGCYVVGGGVVYEGD